MRLRLLPFVPFLIIAACTAKASHPLAGNWQQETGTDAKGMTLEIDPTGTAVNVHTAPGADGGHDHIDGTCTYDAASKAVTVKCKREPPLPADASSALPVSETGAPGMAPVTVADPVSGPRSREHAATSANVPNSTMEYLISPPFVNVRSRLIGYLSPENP